MEMSLTSPVFSKQVEFYWAEFRLINVLIGTTNQYFLAVLHANPSRYSAVVLNHSCLSFFISGRTIKLFFMTSLWPFVSYFLYQNRMSDAFTDSTTE